MRTLVDIPEHDLKALNSIAKAKQVSRAKLVRDAISDYVKVHEKKRTGDGITRSAGAWGKDFEDGLAYQLRLRASGMIVEGRLRQQHLDRSSKRRARCDRRVAEIQPAE